MIEQKLLSDLKIVSQIKSGETLSTSTMTIINHSSWYSSFFRTYSGENRMGTISFVKNLFDNALTTLSKLIETDDFSEGVVNGFIINIREAITGFEKLSDTYSDDSFIVHSIEKIVSDVNENINYELTNLNDRITRDSLDTLDEILNRSIKNFERSLVEEQITIDDDEIIRMIREGELEIEDDIETELKDELKKIHKNEEDNKINKLLIEEERDELKKIHESSPHINNMVKISDSTNFKEECKEILKNDSTKYSVESYNINTIVSNKECKLKKEIESIEDNFSKVFKDYLEFSDRENRICTINSVVY